MVFIFFSEMVPKVRNKEVIFMKRKRLRLLWIVALFTLFIPLAGVVNADDDEHHGEYEEDREYNYWDDDDDDDHDEKQEDDWKTDSYNNFNDGNTLLPSSAWNIWTRETSAASSQNLPIQQAQEVNIQVNGNNQLVYTIPQDGQLLVSGETMAKLIQADCKFYEQSKILEITKGKDELVVRSGSNAAYENLQKTPMPTKAYYFEKSLYAPISVLANAFRYRVSWDENNKTIILLQIQ